MNKLRATLLLLCLLPFAAPAESFREVTPQEAQAFLSDKKPLVLDVRTPFEYGKGHIDGARLINFYGDDFDQRLTKLDRSRPVLLYCASGGRSAEARDRMQQLGFKHVAHLTNGFNGWQRAKLPVTRP